MKDLIKPMLLSYQDKVNSDPNWLYEPKFDGIRLLVGKDISYTRHGILTTNKFPELQVSEDILLDGELTAPGQSSPDNFEGAMARFKGNMEQPIVYMAFDILYVKGKSVMHLPIEERKELLNDNLTKISSPFLRPVPYVIKEGEQLYNIIKDNYMEGITAKHVGSKYTPNRRSNDWRKIINWSFHDVIIKHIFFNPLTVKLQSIEGDYLGGISIGFTKEIKGKLLTSSLPLQAKVKARGWTSNGKLRLPQIIQIKNKT